MSDLYLEPAAVRELARAFGDSAAALQKLMPVCRNVGGPLVAQPMSVILNGMESLRQALGDSFSQRATDLGAAADAYEKCEQSNADDMRRLLDLLNGDGTGSSSASPYAR
jgi:hypothetical protein